MTSLLLTLAVLSALLILLVFIYVSAGKNKKSQDNLTQDRLLTFDEIKAMIASSRTPQKDLYQAVEILISHYITINHEHPLGTYTALLATLCIHPNTDSKLILKYEKALRGANPQYSDEIALALKEGLAARG